METMTYENYEPTPKKVLLGVELTDDEFNFLICEQPKGKELKVIDGKVVAVEIFATKEEMIEKRIAELKQKLKDTDYQAIKFFEGYLTEIMYQPIKKQRQDWRDEINTLEQQLNK